VAVLSTLTRPSVPHGTGSVGSADVAVRGLVKTFPARPAPVTALDDVDLDVPAGSFTAILGESGSGKTTLLRAIAGFTRPDAGTVTIGDRLCAGPGVFVPPERRRVGVLPQDGALFPHLSVAANVGYGLRRGRRRAARVDELLDLVGLAGYGRRMPHELSGGQQQRVALARALAPEPTLVLLDEPFSALDAALRVSLREEVRAVLKATGATAVLVTHDQEEALSMADLVAVMRDGRMVQVADPQKLYTNPVDLQVANFLGEAVVFRAPVVDGLADTPLGRVPVCTPQRSACRLDGVHDVMLRPEQVEISRLDGAAPQVCARVLDMTYFGHDALVRLAVGDGTQLLCRRAGGEPVAVGDPVAVTVRGPAVGFTCD
jgi:iron(III) transport system ATP-binding protein